MASVFVKPRVILTRHLAKITVTEKLPIATRILEICAFLNSKNIPLRFFTHHQILQLARPQLATDFAIKEDIRNAIASLCNCSVTYIGDVFSIDQSAQDMVYAQMDDVRKKEWTYTIAISLSDEVTNDWDTFFPHIHQFFHRAEWLGMDLLTRICLGGLVTTMGKYLVKHDSHVYNLVTGTCLVISYLTGIEDILLDDTNSVIAQLLWCAAVYLKSQNEYTVAEELYLDAITVFCNVSGPKCMEIEKCEQDFHSQYGM